MKLVSLPKVEWIKGATDYPYELWIDGVFAQHYLSAEFILDIQNNNKDLIDYYILSLMSSFYVKIDRSLAKYAVSLLKAIKL